MMRGCVLSSCDFQGNQYANHDWISSDRQAGNVQSRRNELQQLWPRSGQDEEQLNRKFKDTGMYSGVETAM